MQASLSPPPLPRLPPPPLLVTRDDADMCRRHVERDADDPDAGRFRHIPKKEEDEDEEDADDDEDNPGRFRLIPKDADQNNPPPSKPTPRNSDPALGPLDSHILLIKEACTGLGSSVGDQKSS